MSSEAAAQELWSLVYGTPYVVTRDLAIALNRAAAADIPDDVRTHVLLRDSYRALESRWGSHRLHSALSASALGGINTILHRHPSERGFPTLEKRLVEAISPDKLLRFFREVGTAVRQPTIMHVGGSSALILEGYLHRITEDVDVVDQLPDSVRNNHVLLDNLVRNYGLQLTHFQSHYLPDGWLSRVHSLDRFGQLDVFLIDVYDIFIGKMFSRREKDLRDLRVLESALDHQRLATQLADTGKSLASDKGFRESAERNWYVLFGQSLPI